MYSSIDSSIVYQGPNSSAARSTALAQSTVGLNKAILGEGEIYTADGKLIKKNLPSENTTFTVRKLKWQALQELRASS